MASESPDFSGATWQPYATAPTFTLSSGEGGTKTVFFKVRNAGEESAPVSDTIDLMGQTIMLPGDVLLELVWVPSGTYQMGRYPGEADSSNREDPQHPVTMPYGFWMGKYEITQQQWFAVQGSWPGLPPYSSNGMGDTYPVYYVSWYAASGFVTSLNAHIVSSGQGPLTVRLPSEAEWEYAARAGTTTRFYFGDSLGCDGLCTDCAADVLPGNRTDYMWYCGNNSPGGSKPVGGKLPNAFGLYNMSGNVYEWCEDDGHYDYLGAPSDGSAWVDSPRGVTRVYRGGEWSYYASRCRSAYRYTWGPGNSGYNLGLRIAAVPTQVVSFVLNGGAATTADPVVTLDNTATNSPTEYMASESSDFSGATWQPYDTAPVFTLSAFEGGTKTVYFKVRNAGGESASVSDTIDLTGRTITLPGDVPLDLAWVPLGSFQMGRYPGEADSVSGEDPQHSVTLAYGFWMGKYEITQQQWLAVRGQPRASIGATIWPTQRLGPMPGTLATTARPGPSPWAGNCRTPWACTT
jgi:formylglycine-generating enzyme required for sulfatase activity